jgi:hypothetical protein
MAYSVLVLPDAEDDIAAAARGKVYPLAKRRIK